MSKKRRRNKRSYGKKRFKKRGFKPIPKYGSSRGGIRL